MKMKFERPKGQVLEKKDKLFTPEGERVRLGSILDKFRQTPGAKRFIETATLATLLLSIGAGCKGQEKIAPEVGDNDNREDKFKSEVVVDGDEIEAGIVIDEEPETSPEERQAHREKYFNDQKADDMEKGIQLNSDKVFELRMKYADVERGEDRDPAIALEMYEAADKENMRDVLSVLEAMTEHDYDEDTKTVSRTAVEGQSAEWQEMKDIVMEIIEGSIPEGELSDTQKAALAENIKEILAIADGETGVRFWDDISAAMHESLEEGAIALEDPETSVSVLKYLENVDHNNWSKGDHDRGDYFAYHDHSYEFKKIYEDLAAQTEAAGGEREMVYESMQSSEKQEEFVKFLAENKDNVNEEVEDIEGSEWTVERIQESMDQDTKERAEARSTAIEAGEPVVSEDMHKLETVFWQDLHKSWAADIEGTEYESQKEAIKLKMHEAAKDGENLEDTLHAYFRLHQKTAGGNFERSWETSADLRDQSPEWHEINDLLMAEINEPIPEGELTPGQIVELVEHTKDLERINEGTRGVRYDGDMKTGIYEKIRDAAVKTEMVELQLIARAHMDSYELTHAKDHSGGALPESKHSPEWRDIKNSLKEKLNSVEGAESVWWKGPARDELVKLMNDNGIE